jgi:hypothetical protein
VCVAAAETAAPKSAAGYAKAAEFSESEDEQGTGAADAESSAAESESGALRPLLT